MFHYSSYIRDVVFRRILFLALFINFICSSYSFCQDASQGDVARSTPVDNKSSTEPTEEGSVDTASSPPQKDEIYVPPKLEHPPKLTESFIALIVSQNISSGYYKSYVDENEDPYIDIKEFLTNYLGFENVQCDTKKLYCECTMPPNDTFFWFDGKNAEMGNSESKAQKLDPLLIVVKDDKLWVRFDVIGEWLPLNADWALDTYMLGLLPRFKLVYDKKVEHENLLKRLKVMQDQQAAEDRKTIIYPEDLFDASARYRVGLIKPAKQSLSSSVDYDLTLDAFTGTGKLGQSMSFPFDQRRSINVPYGIYSLKDKKYFYLVEVGNTSLQDASLLIHDTAASYGLRFDSRKRDQYLEGKISITDFAPKGTEVDLYVNGYYTASAVVGDDGRYTFPDINVNETSSIKLKIYYTNGLEEEKPINVSRGENRLPIGTLEERFFVGKMSQSDFNAYYGSLRYGLLDNVSIGVSPLFLSTMKNVKPLVDMSFMPFYWVNFFGQGFINGSSIDRGFRANFTLLDPNFIQLEHMYYNNNSPLIPLGRSSVGEYWSMRHQINFARVGFDTEFEQNEMSRKLSNSFRFNINNYIRPTVTSDFYFLRLNNSFSYDVATALGFDFSPNSRMDLSRIWSNALSRNLISYTLKDSSDIGGWDVTVKIELDDNRTKNASVNLNYRLTENIQVGASLQNQYLGAQIYWNGLLVGKNGPDSWERFDTGTVTGRIEDTSEGEPKPVPGAVIFVGNREATTDDNGYYRVNGVAVDTPVKARIEPTSLDNRLIPDTDYDLLYLRRGTHINWCPVLATTIGLDGYIDSDADIMPGTKVIATRLSDYRVMSTSDIDPADGFFVLERLTPGKYQLSIDRESLKAKPVVIEIKPNTDWISGVRWDIDLSKFEFTKDNENGVVSIEDKITEETVKIPTAEAEETVTVNPVKSPDDDTYAKELRSIQNIIQIKLHNIQLAPDADSSFRLKTYNKLIMITDKMQRDWDKLSTASKISSINKIKLLLFSPLLTKDELDKDHLQKLRLIARERMGKAETVKDSNKLEMYERLNRLLDKLEKEWDKLSRDEKRKKLEGIEKILNYIESL